MVLRLIILYTTIYSVFTFIYEYIDEPSNKNVSKKELICSIAKTPASYPAGNDSLLLFISKNIRWVNPDFCGEGTVVVKFTIDENGSSSDFEVVRSLEESFDKEAIRVLKLIKKWSPGLQYNKPVSCEMIMPIRFRLE